MDNATKPTYWNERTQSEGREAVVRRGYTTQQMRATTEAWWLTLRPYFKGAGRVLEVGCGWGRWAEKISGVAESYTGVDVCKELVDRCRPGYDIRLIEPGRLPFSDNSFDCVTTITVLQHISDADMGVTVREMARVLDSGGRLVSVENTTHLPGFRSVEAYKAALSPVALDVSKIGEIVEGKEVMSIFYGDRS